MANPDGMLIQQLRVKRGLTPAQLAKKTSIGLSSVYHIENGRPCKQLVLWRIATALGTTADKISDMSDEETPEEALAS